MRDKPGVAVVRVHAVEAVVLLVRGSRRAAEHTRDGARGACQSWHVRTKKIKTDRCCHAATARGLVLQIGLPSAMCGWLAGCTSDPNHIQINIRLTNSPATGAGVASVVTSLVLVHRHKLHTT